MMDINSSHYTPEAITEAAQEGIIIFCLPPNTTHAAQPLDVSFFKPLKSYWSQACHSFLADHPDSAVTKLQFSRLFSEAWMKACKPSNIVSGFRKTGICPLNPAAIKITGLLLSGSDSDDSNSDAKHGDRSQSRDQTNKDTDSDSSLADATRSPDDSLILQFSAEQLDLFEKRYENGYNIYVEQDYVSWLQLYHPVSLPDDVKPKCEVTPKQPPNSDDSLAMHPDLPECEYMGLTWI